MSSNESLIVVKSDGSAESFSEDKLSNSLLRANVPADKIPIVVSTIKDHIYNMIPSSQIRQWVISELNKINPEYSKGFLYKKKNVFVVGGYAQRHIKDSYEPFSKKRIVNSLVKETGMPEDVADKVAYTAEQMMIENDIHQISGSLIREITNYLLLKNNFDSYYKAYQKIGWPVYDLTELISHGSHENANQQYNPETIHKLIADSVVRNYTLTKILPSEIANAHINGVFHIHDLDYFPLRPFCFSHDLRFFLKNGLKADGTGLHTAIAGPAKNSNVAILHAAKVLACGQVNCAGGQGFNWFNIMLAPYLKGKSYDEIKQLAQMFIYEMSMMYVSRGGQVVFSSIDIEPGIPDTLADIPAVQPGGVVQENVTYSDYHDEANQFFNAITDVYLDGDYKNKPFSFPKYELKIDKKDFARYPGEMLKVSQLAAKFGTPYYFIQQDYLPKYACYQCCSYLMPLSDQNEDSDLYNGTVRGGGIQVVCINLPQIAYEAKGDDVRFFELLHERMELAKKVIEIKKDLIRQRMAMGLLPFLSQPINESGKPYYIVDKQGCEIAMVGLNEMLKCHIGNELHEAADAWSFGLKVISEMKKTVAKFREETGSLFGLSRSPAESASHRLAKIDLARYGNRAVVQGNPKTKSVYYTNSTHIRPSANVGLFERVQKEAAFHPLLDGGAMSHIWLGEKDPDPEGITKLTQRIANNTLMSYFAYNRDITICNECQHTVSGVRKECPKCKSTNVDWWSRITGYYQKVSSWNEGKKQEFMDRYRYNL